MIDESPTGGTERGETSYTVAPHSCPHCEGALERGGGRYNCGDCGRSWGVIYIEHVHEGRCNNTDATHSGGHGR